MSAQHTPGPWAQNPSAKDEIVAPDEPMIIARIPWGQSGLHNKRAPANARLIAAAPDLLEALERCRDKFAEYASLHLAKGTRDGILKAQANADMANLICGPAIAKARGQ